MIPDRGDSVMLRGQPQEQEFTIEVPAMLTVKVTARDRSTAQRIITDMLHRLDWRAAGADVDLGGYTIKLLKARRYRSGYGPRQRFGP